jgi:spermidine/putrescine transport system ATP-binding protein
VSASAASAVMDASGTPASSLSIRAVAKRFGHREVLRAISLEVAAGEFLTILGESGSGKTTLLRLIAGFELPDSGEIWMAGERVDCLPPYRRRVNTVFQSYALFPHLSVFENVAYGLRVQGAPKAEIPTRVEQALTLVKMTDFATSAPAKLSGGQQQRIALARALVNRPAVLLLDEPLSALDANLRRQMQIELKSLQREVGISFVFVTHDQDEAMALSDRIALLRAGTLEQVAAPREIYSRPRTAYTAQFIGQTNVLQGAVRGGIATAGAITWLTVAPDGPTVFSLRPECIRLAAARRAVPPVGGADHQDARIALFHARIQSQTFGGSTDLLEAVCSDGRVLRVRVSNSGPLDGDIAFEFDAADAMPVAETGKA